MTGQIILLSGATPNPPSPGKVAIYTKADKTVYTQDEQGNEHSLAVNSIGAMSSWPVMTVPAGFALCNGQLLSVSQYPELFAVLGDSHGGDGVTTFALPNLRSFGVYQTIMRVCSAAVSVTPTTVIVPCVIHGPKPDSYLAGDVLAFTVQLIDPVTVSGSIAKLEVAINGVSHLLSPTESTPTAWHYAYTVAADGTGELIAEINLNGAILTTDSVPVILSTTYFVNNKNLSTDSDDLSAAMTPTAETPSISQDHALSDVEATTTPTADTGSVT